MRGRLELLWLVGVSVKGPRTYGRRLATLFALVTAGIVSFGFGLSAPTDAGSEPSLGFRPPELAATPRSTAPPVTKPTRAEPAAPGASAIASPRFVWAAEEGTTRYRFALYRNGRTIFQRDVKSNVLLLPEGWTYEGRSYALAKGTYRWVVWPLVGKGRNLRPAPAIVSASYVV